MKHFLTLGLGIALAQAGAAGVSYYPASDFIGQNLQPQTNAAGARAALGISGTNTALINELAAAIASNAVFTTVFNTYVYNNLATNTAAISNALFHTAFTAPVVRADTNVYIYNDLGPIPPQAIVLTNTAGLTFNAAYNPEPVGGEIRAAGYVTYRVVGPCPVSFLLTNRLNWHGAMPTVVTNGTLGFAAYGPYYLDAWYSEGGP